MVWSNDFLSPWNSKIHVQWRLRFFGLFPLLGASRVPFHAQVQIWDPELCWFCLWPRVTFGTRVQGLPPRSPGHRSTSGGMLGAPRVSSPKMGTVALLVLPLAPGHLRVRVAARDQGSGGTSRAASRLYGNVRGSALLHTKIRSLKIFPGGSLRAGANGPNNVPRIYEERSRVAIWSRGLGFLTSILYLIGGFRLRQLFSAVTRGCGALSASGSGGLIPVKRLLCRLHLSLGRGSEAPASHGVGQTFCVCGLLALPTSINSRSGVSSGR